MSPIFTTGKLKILHHIVDRVIDKFMEKMNERATKAETFDIYW